MSQSEQKLDILGIDISKAKFDIALIKAGGEKFKNKVFANTPAGFEQLQQWLTSQNVTQLHGCMEATSTYGNALARFLFEIGYRVSIVCLVSLFTQGEPAEREPQSVSHQSFWAQPVEPN